MIGSVPDPVAVEILPPAAVQESQLTGPEFGPSVENQLKFAVHRQRHRLSARIEEESEAGDEDDSVRPKRGMANS